MHGDDVNDQHLAWIKTALDSDPQGLTLADVKASLETGQAQLWPTDKGCAVTEITDENELNVWLYGGDISEIPKLLTSCIAWCGVMGIPRLIMWGGRKGWVRYLKRYKFKEYVLDNRSIMTREIGNV